MTSRDPVCADLIFREARSYNAWTERPVDRGTLNDLYELMKWGPTSSNGAPLRIVFVETFAGKQRLAAHAAERNGPKILEAPVTAILAYDPVFFEHLPRLFPHNPEIEAMYRRSPPLVAETAMRNASIQGGYFILAARMLGLDCGPMSGFNNAAVDADFFADVGFRSNFLCMLGYGDSERDLWPRLPRLSFEEVCTFE